MPDRVDRLAQIVLLDDRIGPNAGKQFFLFYEIAVIADKMDESQECLFG